MTTATETGLVRIHEWPIENIKPSPENDKLYKPVDSHDPEIIALANSIIEHGVLAPLVISLDQYIISGHRRFAAAKLAGLEAVPCRIEQIVRADDVDAFVVMLREHNRQRNKTHAEKLREEVVSIDPDVAYRRLVEFREAKSDIKPTAIKLKKEKPRAKISEAKLPMLEAADQVIAARAKFWPLSIRQIHYAMLNNPPLKHKSKPASRYKNDVQSYKDLCDLLTRARMDGCIPMEAIDDETRPFCYRQRDDDVQSYIRDELRIMFSGYQRNLLQSQLNHIEVLVEKNTVAPICKPICGKYCVPMTSLRGYCSVPPRRDMSQRFEDSGKERLIVLIASDFDPEGEDIAETFPRSMRDEFGVENIQAIKVALTHEQSKRYSLPEDATAKKTSSRAKKFVKQYGDKVWELEALPPETLQTLLEDAIQSILDLDAFNAEREAEKADAVFLERIRAQAVAALQDAGFGDDE